MIGSVYFFWSVNRIRGSNNLFQLLTKLKIACVAIAGFMIGSAILLKIKNSPAPSIRALCTISMERAGFMYCLMKNTMEGEAIAGRISMLSLFVIWIL